MCVQLIELEMFLSEVEVVGRAVSFWVFLWVFVFITPSFLFMFFGFILLLVGVGVCGDCSSRRERRGEESGG